MACSGRERRERYHFLFPCKQHPRSNLPDFQRQQTGNPKSNDTEIDIEVQLSELSVWAERSLFYLSKMYVEQINPGDSYNIFKKCVSISILDFELFDDTEDFYSCFHITEDTRRTLYTDKMEFHVLELPKLPKELKDGDNILLWAKFINAEQKEEFDMIATKDPYIESAYQTLQVILLSEFMIIGIRECQNHSGIFSFF